MWELRRYRHFTAVLSWNLLRKYSFIKFLCENTFLQNSAAILRSALFVCLLIWNVYSLQRSVNRETHKVCAFYARPPARLSAGKHKTNHSSLKSLNRQALTGIDQCSDGGMWMSHVFSIIYTALLFLSPPLRQVSILLHRNQSVICQTLSIRRLIYVSYCGWLHASATAGKEQMGRETFRKRHLVFTGNKSILELRFNF